MKWKEFLEIEDCDLCPIKKAELCGGGASCYGGSPKTIDELKNQIEIAKEKYKAKRKEFYANRKQDHPTEKGGEADA